jgi:hypothetical protein
MNNEYQRHLLALHAEEIGKVLERAAELTNAATNAESDFHLSSEWSRLSDLIDGAKERLASIRAESVA